MKGKKLEKILENIKEKETYGAKEITKALAESGFKVEKRPYHLVISKDGKQDEIPITGTRETGYQLFGIRLLQALEEFGYFNS